MQPLNQTPEKNNAQSPSRRFCVAPMLDWTDRHDRYFLRLISKHAFLYTEMVTTGALLYGSAERHLRFNPEEQPLAIQLGGSDPKALTLCAKMAEEQGYKEINLNLGCPSDRVQSGTFGACLMKTPSLVKDLFERMQEAVSIPVTLKCRLGVDDQDEEKDLQDFISPLYDAGCATFIIHARKAWLKGLSPKENRSVPPLNYPRVHRLKKDFPKSEFILNGGLSNHTDCLTQLKHIDGVMIGRWAYQDPWLCLSSVDKTYFGAKEAPNRENIIEKMVAYIEEQQKNSVPVKSITRHMMGLFSNEPGARAWRRTLSTEACKPDVSGTVLFQALEEVTRCQKEDRINQKERNLS